MLKTPSFFHVGGLAALMALASLAACSGGCGNCNVPNFNGPPGATPAPSPLTTPTPIPTPTPTVGALSCSQGQAGIALGAALAPFAVLAGSTVTNVGNTIVTYAPGAITGSFHDDLIGVWPGTAVTGFPPGTDTDGTNAIYAAGFNTTVGVPMAAQGALTTAYNAVVAKAPTTTFVGTPDLSQSNSTVSNCGATGTLVCPKGTLGAGVYKASTTASIMTGNLTLDGGGNAQSVFIFQIGTSLTTTLNGGVSGNVILINSAGACNIYWAEGAAATLGGATFYGNVLTGPVDTGTESITINATTFTGRALAKTAVSIPVAGGSLITNPGGS